MRKKNKDKMVDECDNCGEIVQVKKYGRFKYCKKCKEEVDRGN